MYHVAFLVFVFDPRTDFRFKAVIDGCTCGGAADGHVLCFIVSAAIGVESRCSHGRCGRNAAFTLHEDVEEEVVLAVVHVAGGIGLYDALRVSDTQSHGTGVSGGIDDVEAEIVGNQGTFS